MNYQKVYINQVSSTATMDYLTQMWKNQLLCDAVIKTGNKVTKAHRVVLIAACPMLQSMDNASLGSHLEVRMAADIKQDSINAFLQYIYEGYVMLTEENCKDIEKMAKLLQVESLLNCCSDFYKNLSEKTGIQHGGLLLNCKHGLNLQHLKFSSLQKTVSDTAMKRGAVSKEVMSDSKRQRFCTESEKERGPTHDWPSVSGTNSSEQSNVAHLVEENLEVIHTDPATRDEEGWPEWSSGPGVSQSQAISVSSQQNVQSDTQVVRISDDDSGSISTDGSVEQLHHMKITSQNSIPLYPSNNSIPSELHQASTASAHVSVPNIDSTTCQLSHIPVTIGHQQFSQSQSLSSSAHIPFAAGSERQQIYVEPLSDLPKSERMEEFAGRNFVSGRTTLSDDSLTKQSKGDSVEDESQKVTDLLSGEKSQQSNQSLKTVDLTRVKVEEDETGGLELSVDPCQDVEENIDDYDDGVDDDISYEQEDSMVRTDESPHSVHSKEGQHQSQVQEPLFSRSVWNKDGIAFTHTMCPRCLSSFETPAALRSHFQSEHGVYAICKCGRSFKSCYSYSYHYKVKHSEKKNVFSCPICGITTVYFSSMKRHIATHSDASRCTCHICGRSYSRKDSLKSHMSSHAVDIQSIDQIVSNATAQPSFSPALSDSGLLQTQSMNITENFESTPQNTSSITSTLTSQTGQPVIHLD